MKDHISAETVSDTWEKMAESSLQDTESVIEQMKDEQPVLLGYLVSMDDYPFNNQEREFIFYIGVVVWQIIKQKKNRLIRVEHGCIKEAESANSTFIELLSAGTESGLLEATQAMLKGYGEPEVLRCVLEAIMEEEDPENDAPLIREECIGLAFIHLKVILDAFIRSLE